MAYKMERHPTRFVKATNEMLEKMLVGFSDYELTEMLATPTRYETHVIELARIEAISRGMLKPEVVH